MPEGAADTHVEAGGTRVPVQGALAADVNELRLLAGVTRAIAELLDSTGRPPSGVSVCIGSVSAELCWDVAPTQAAIAPVAAPAVAPVNAPVMASAPGTTTEALGADATIPMATDSAAAAAPGGWLLRAPALGVFYRRPSPNAEPFVAEGDVATAGQQVAVVEVMKMMIPVEAERPGRVVRLLVADGETVEFDEPLVEFGQP